MAKAKEETTATKKKKVTSSTNKFYKEMTLEFMMDYINKNAPNEKEWFKSVAKNSKGKYQHLIAKKAFCEKFMPDKIPQRKERVNKSDVLENW